MIHAECIQTKKEKLFKKYQELLSKKRDLLDDIECLFDEYHTEDDYDVHRGEQTDSYELYNDELYQEINELEKNIKSVNKDIEDLEQILKDMKDDILCYEGFQINDDGSNPYLDKDFYPFFKKERKLVETHIDKYDKEKKALDKKIEEKPIF